MLHVCPVLDSSEIKYIRRLHKASLTLVSVCNDEIEVRGEIAHSGMEC
jgi:hypothetical protein